MSDVISREALGLGSEDSEQEPERPATAHEPCDYEDEYVPCDDEYVTGGEFAPRGSGGAFKALVGIAVWRQGWLQLQQHQRCRAGCFEPKCVGTETARMTKTMTTTMTMTTIDRQTDRQTDLSGGAGGRRNGEG